LAQGSELRPRQHASPHHAHSEFSKATMVLDVHCQDVLKRKFDVHESVEKQVKKPVTGKEGVKIPAGVFPMPGFLDKYLDECKDQYEVHLITPDPTFATAERDILKWVPYCKKHGIKHISSFDHEYMIWQAILNELIADAGTSPSLSSMAFAMNKYHTRQLDDPKFWSVAVDGKNPKASIAEVAGRYPCMVKASCLNLARGVFTARSNEHFLQIVDGTSEQAQETERFRDAIKRFLPSDDQMFPSFMAEMRLDLLDPKLKQFSVECLCTSSGQFRTHSVREELYFSTYQKIGYVCPPPSLNKAEVAKLVKFTDHIGRQLVETGFVNQFFNMEVWHMPSGDFHLVEVNVLPNPHFVGVNFHLTGNNYMREFLDLHLKLKPPSTQIIEGIMKGTLGKVCLQSEMSCVSKGRMGDLLDMDALRKLPYDKHCMMWMTDDEFVLSDEHMSPAGWAAAEVFLEGSDLADVLRKDMELRKTMYKVNCPSIDQYPDIAALSTREA